MDQNPFKQFQLPPPVGAPPTLMQRASSAVQKGIGAIGNMFSSTQQVVNNTPPKDVTAGILNAENKGAIAQKKDLYKVIGITGDLGKYQTNPLMLRDWGQAWLGRKVTPAEFLNNPDFQEQFYQQFLQVAQAHNLTPEQTAMAWHTGIGQLGTGPHDTRSARFMDSLQQRMQDPKYQGYMKNFNQGATSSNG